MVTMREVDYEGSMELIPSTSPLCWFGAGMQKSYGHLFVHCSKKQDAGLSLLRCIQSYDRAALDVQSLRLELVADDPFITPSVAILARGLELICETKT